MGGYNVGELFGLLRLDDSQFRQALEDATLRSKAFSVDLSNIGTSLQRLKFELSEAGIGFGGLSTTMAQFRALGMKDAEAVQDIVRALTMLQDRIQSIAATPPIKLPIEQIEFAKNNPLGGLTQRELEERREALSALGKSDPFQKTSGAGSTEERIRIEQDAAKRIKEIRARDEGDIQAAARRAIDEAKETAAKRVQIELDAAKRIKEVQDQAILNAEGSLRIANEREANNAKIAKERYAKDWDEALLMNKEFDRLAAEKEAVFKRLDEGATARRKDALDQMLRDAQAEERIEREKAEEKIRINREAQARERALYVEHRRQMQAASALTTIGATLAGAGGVGIAGGVVVAKDAAEFQDAMAKSMSVIGDLSDQMVARLAGAAREAAKQTGIAAKTIASDYAIMAKGGFDAANSLRLTPEITKFAVATQSELHESTKQVITIMEALKLPVSDVNSLLDKLTFANQVARGSVDQLATALEGKAGASLRSAKVSLDEALAMTIAFSKAGVSASQSQTFLTQIIEKLRSAATTYGRELIDVGGKQMKFRDIIYLSDGTMRPFIETLKILDTAFQGRSAAAIDKFFADIHVGSARGSQGLKILLGATENLTTLSEKLENVGGAMQKAFDAQLKSPLRQLEIFEARVKDLAITVGIPLVNAMLSAGKAAEPLFKGIEGVTKSFSELPSSVQTSITLIAAGGAVFTAAAGGVLLFAGHIVRLRADLLLLQEAGIFTNLGTGAAALASRLGLIGIAIAGITAAVVALRAEADRFSKFDGKNQIEKLDNGAGTFYGFGYNPSSTPQANNFTQGASESLAARRKMVADEMSAEEKLLANIGKGNKDQTLDEFRKLSEEIAAQMKSVFNAGDFAIDPEAVLKKSLKVEDVRQDLAKFSDEYSRDIDKLSAEQQDVISRAMSDMAKALASGTDMRVVRKQLSDAQLDLTRFVKESNEAAAQEQKDESNRLAIQSATNAVNAFKEKYLADLRQFSAEERGVLDSLLGGLQDELTRGVDPKIISKDLDFAEKQYKAMAANIKAAADMQREFTQATREYDLVAKKALRQREGEITVPLEQRIPDVIAQKLPTQDDSKRLSEIDSIMKALGVTSQETLNRQAAAARALVAELSGLGATGYEVHAALVKEWEAEAAAAHIAVEKVSSDARRYYRIYKDEVENSVIAANKRWRQTLSEISHDLRTIIGDFSRALISSLIPDAASATDKLKPIVDAFRDAFGQLAAYADPKKALENVINSIIKAGTVAKANAIAVRYFGETMGPQLARDLRSGALSADDVRKAIDRATVSVKEFAADSEQSTSKVASAWNKMVRDIEVMIAEHLIKLGIAELLKWIFKLKTDTMDLGKIMVEIWTKIKDAIGLGVKAATSAAEVTIDNLPINKPGIPGIDVPNFPQVPGTKGVPQIPGGGGGNPAGGPAGGVQAFAGQAATAWISAIGSAVSAVTGVIGVFQSMHQETSLNAIEHNTRYSALYLNEIKTGQGSSPSDVYALHEQIMAKFDDLANTIATWIQDLEGVIRGIKITAVGNFDFKLSDLRDMNSAVLNKFDLWGGILEDTFRGNGPSGAPVADFGELTTTVSYWMELLVSRFDQFVIPSLNTLAGGLVASGGGGGEVINIDTLNLNGVQDTKALVRELKSRRIPLSQR